MVNLLIALTSLKESWQRSVLSSLGVMVAGVAIILLISIAHGVEKDIRGQVEELGVNVLVVLPGRVESGMFNPNLGGQSYLKEQDAERLAQVPGVRRTAALSFAGGGIRYQGEDIFTPLTIAAEPNWFRMHAVDLEHGRLITEEDENADVAVVGSVAANDLFGSSEDALGKEIEINQQSYTVVGVTESQNGDADESLFSMGSFQNVVYIPYSTLQANLPNMQTHRVMVQSEPEADPEVLVPALEEALGERLDRQQYSVLTQEDLLGLIYELMSILSWLLIGLTSIALFVGGVGIMAIMLMAVNERKREIGVRKAVGAHRQDIFRQILVESVAIGLIGITVALALSWVISIALTLYTPIEPDITAQTVLLAFAVGIGLGAFFGVLPAMKAARQDPVVALRQE
jgi:putative ABC transport system permease protein